MTDLQTGTPRGVSLWVTDGTAAGTQKQVDLPPGVFVSYEAGLGSEAFFVGIVHAVPEARIWRTDGTANGTQLVRDFGGPGPYEPLQSQIAFGGALYFTADDFSLTATHFSPEQLTEKAHHYELVPERETTVIIDARQAGIGSNSCGPELSPEYRLDRETIAFTFRIKPVFAGDLDPWREMRTKA